jgi:hypothetical protein
MMKIAGALALAAILAGCAQQRFTFVRLDGKPVSDPVLSSQFEVDRAVCAGDREKASLSGTTFSGGGFAGMMARNERGQSADAVANGCMAQRGYLSVPEEQAAQKAAELAAVDAERKRQEAVAMPPARVVRR